MEMPRYVGIVLLIEVDVCVWFWGRHNGEFRRVKNLRDFEVEMEFTSSMDETIQEVSSTPRLLLLTL